MWWWLLVSQLLETCGAAVVFTVFIRISAKIAAVLGLLPSARVVLRRILGSEQLFLVQIATACGSLALRWFLMHFESGDASSTQQFFLFFSFSLSLATVVIRLLLQSVAAMFELFFIILFMFTSLQNASNATFAIAAPAILLGGFVVRLNMTYVTSPTAFSSLLFGTSFFMLVSHHWRQSRIWNRFLYSYTADGRRQFATFIESLPKAYSSKCVFMEMLLCLKANHLHLPVDLKRLIWIRYLRYEPLLFLRKSNFTVTNVRFNRTFTVNLNSYSSKLGLIYTKLFNVRLCVEENSAGAFQYLLLYAPTSAGAYRIVSLSHAIFYRDTSAPLDIRKRALFIEDHSFVAEIFLPDDVSVQDVMEIKAKVRRR